MELKNLNLSQEHTSKDTSVNVVNRVYRHYDFNPNSIILDYGGGKYDSNKEYMWNLNHSLVCIVDKYNRSSEHNLQALEYLAENTPKYVVCSNVLNVIKEDEVVSTLLDDISKNFKQAIFLFAVYSGNKSGIGAETSKGYQRNLKTKYYIEYLVPYFDDIIIKRDIIICRSKWRDGAK